MQENVLEKIGMSNKEAKTYLKLLELGESTNSNIAKHINEKRTTTYSILEIMEEKELVISRQKGKAKYFTAISPRKLLSSYANKTKSFKKILPELLAIQNENKKKPKITFYEGVDGIKQIGEILLEVPNSTRESFMGIEEETIHPEIKKYYEEEFIARRIESGIQYKGIVTNYIPISKKHSPDEKSQLRELKYIDPKLFPIKIHIDIFEKNKVALYSYNKDELMGVIIEHESFYKTMRTVFKLAWIGASNIE